MTITLENLSKVVVEHPYTEAKVYLTDGRVASITEMDFFQGVNIFSLVAQVASEKINPEGGASQYEIVCHFDSVMSRARLAPQLRLPSVVLNEIFNP